MGGNQNLNGSSQILLNKIACHRRSGFNCNKVEEKSRNGNNSFAKVGLIWNCTKAKHPGRNQGGAEKIYSTFCYEFQLKQLN
jgi:hypothetical protein